MFLFMCVIKPDFTIHRLKTCCSLRPTRVFVLLYVLSMFRVKHSIDTSVICCQSPQQKMFLISPTL